MPHSFVIYIDEAGDEGFVFNPQGRGGSTEWFVLSAAIVRRVDDARNVAVMDAVRARLGKTPRAPIHFSDLKHEQRLAFLDELPLGKYRIVSVLVHKRSLRESERFRRRYQFYFYFTKFLLERASWYCRDMWHHQEPDDGSAVIVFSNRRNLSYDELKNYLCHLREISAAREISIDWGVVKPERIAARPHQQVAGLQIADAAATGMFMAANISGYGMNEPRYAELLKPHTYHHRGRYQGYGVKFFPTSLPAALQRDRRYEWIERLFG